MGKRYEASTVICPYYRSQQGSVIYCEALAPADLLHVAFRGVGQLRRYRESHCDRWDYADSGCIIARGLEDYWEGRTASAAEETADAAPLPQETAKSQSAADPGASCSLPTIY